MKKRLRIVSIILLLSLLLTGCGVDDTVYLTDSTTKATTEATETIQDTTVQKEETTAPTQGSTGDDDSQPSYVEDNGSQSSDSQSSGDTSTSQPTQAPEQIQPAKPAEPAVPADSSFEIHFIDVGQADAALVLCDGKAMLIDGGNKADSNVMYTYLKNRNITYLDYVIGTHAHEDHIGGIPGALQYATAGTVYCPVTSYSSKAFTNFKTAAEEKGGGILVPRTGDTFSLGSAQCTVLAVNYDDDANNSSIVLRIVYGNTSFMFTGDAEREVEEYILNSGKTVDSTVLKVGHHGSDTSTGYYWLRQVDPEYAVICVGKGNTYGHPTDAVLSRLRDAEVTTFRTDMQGDIICTSDGNAVTFTVSKNKDADTLG